MDDVSLPKDDNNHDRGVAHAGMLVVGGLSGKRFKHIATRCIPFENKNADDVIYFYHDPKDEKYTEIFAAENTSTFRRVRVVSRKPTEIGKDISYFSSLLEKRTQEKNNNTILFNRKLEEGTSERIFILIDNFGFYKNTIIKISKENGFELLNQLDKLASVGIYVILTASRRIFENAVEPLDFRNFAEIHYLGGLSPDEEEMLVGRPVYCDLRSSKIYIKKPGELVRELAPRFVIKKKDHCPFIINEFIKLKKGEFDPGLLRINFLNLKTLGSYPIYDEFINSRFVVGTYEGLYTIAIGKYIFDMVIKNQNLLATNEGKVELIRILKDCMWNEGLESDSNNDASLSRWLYRLSLGRSTSKPSYVDYFDNSYTQHIECIVTHYMNEVYQLLKRKKGNQIIKSIIVRKLFGYSSFKVDFSDMKLSLFTATNGFGKTTIFNIINILLKRKENFKDCFDDFVYIEKMPFESFRIVFGNGYYIEYNKESNQIIYGLEDDKEPIKNDIPSVIQNENDDLESERVFKEFIDKHYNIVRQYFENKLWYIPLNEESIDAKFFETLSNQLLQYQESSENLSQNNLGYRKLLKIYNKYKNRSIGSLGATISTLCSRLSSLTLSSFIFNNKYHDMDSLLRININGELFNNIREMENANFLSELFTEDKPLKLKAAQQRECNGIENKCIAEGEETTMFDINDLANFDTITSLVAELYRGYKSFLLFKKCFESIYDKNNPSRKIVSQKNGNMIFTCVSSENEKLDSNQLSSGESNIARIIYQIIFSNNDYRLLLLDEPEVSLHIAWQDRIMNIIPQLIRNKEEIQLIIATHSPFISAGFSSCECEIEILDNQSGYKRNI